MQIILLEKIHKLGALGDVVKVRAGYARNYLIPTGKAKRATSENIAEFETIRVQLETQERTVRKEAEEKASKLSGENFSITRKAGVDGRLFGSVTNQDIADELTNSGHEVQKSMIRLPDGPIKQVGENKISVQFHADINVDILISVVGDQ